VKSEIKKIWIFEGKSGKTFPEEKKFLTEHLKNFFEIVDKPSKSVSLAISLAGDGSLLSMIRNLGDLRHEIPMLGIHTSSGLGFLHRLAFPKDKKNHKKWVLDLAKCLKNGKYSIQKRWGVEASVGRHQKCWGMNDLVMSKGALSRMVSLRLEINGSLLFSKIRGDGLIIASPTGSTAYSLAAGGPIVLPGLEGILVTPILPHQVAQRPLVLSSDSQLKVEILEGPPCFLTEDGQRTTEMKVGQSLMIARSQKPVLWLDPGLDGARDYFELLRTKLGLGGHERGLKNVDDNKS